MFWETDNLTATIFTLQQNNFDFGLNDYEIFDEAYRPILNEAILNAYMFREIFDINPVRFRFELRRRMDLIMRNKYNALYKQKLVEFNPLFNQNLTETYTRNLTATGENINNGTINTSSSNTSNNTSSSTTSNTTNNTNDSNSTQMQLNSQFPSEELTEGDLTNNLFVNSAIRTTATQHSEDSTEDNGTNDSTNDTTSSGTNSTATNNTGNTTNNAEETYTKKMEGSSFSFSPVTAMLQFKKYVDAYNLDALVIRELRDLFITVY